MAEVQHDGVLSLGWVQILTLPPSIFFIAISQSYLLNQNDSGHYFMLWCLLRGSNERKRKNNVGLIRGPWRGHMGPTWISLLRNTTSRILMGVWEGRVCDTSHLPSAFRIKELPSLSLTETRVYKSHFLLYALPYCAISGKGGVIKRLSLSIGCCRVALLGVEN
jgi:hypothetical protein